MKRGFLWPIVAAALWLSAGSLRALEGEASLGMENLIGDYANPKFNQYEYLGNSALRVMSRAEIRQAVEGKPDFVNLDWKGTQDADNGDLTGGDGNFSLGSYGLYRLDYSFEEIGHTYELGVPSLYSGAGTGALSIDHAIQTDIQNTPSAQVVGKLRAYLASANPIDVAVKRDQQKISADWTPNPNTELKIATSQEHKTGTMPFSVNFGTSDSVQVPAPIDYTTTNLAVSAEVFKDGADASVSYRHSDFSNAYESFLFSNPLRGVDTATGAATGRYSLPPSNTSDSLGAALEQNMPFNSRLVATSDSSWSRQNEQIMPYTVNPAIPGIPALPEATVGGQVDSSRTKISLDSRPLSGLKLGAYSGLSTRTNNTPLQTFVTVLYDSQATTTSAFTPDPYVSTVTHEMGVSASYEILYRTELGVEYGKTSELLTNSSASSMDEDIYKLNLDNHSFRWTTLRMGYQRDVRRVDYEPITPTASDGNMLWAEKYYNADRVRDQGTAMWTLMPTDSLTASFEYNYAKDNYDTNWFGLLDGTRQYISVSAEYQVLEWLSLSPSYVYDTNLLNSRLRNYSNTISNPYVANLAYPDPLTDPSNYTVANQETGQTISLDAGADLVQGVWRMDLTGSYCINQGALNISSPVGPANLDVSPWPVHGFANFDDSTELALDLKNKITIAAGLGLTVGYKYQTWSTDDFNYGGYNQVASTGTGAYNSVMTMQILPPTYTVQTVYSSVDYRF